MAQASAGLSKITDLCLCIVWELDHQVMISAFELLLRLYVFRSVGTYCENACMPVIVSNCYAIVC